MGVWDLELALLVAAFILSALLSIYIIKLKKKSQITTVFLVQQVLLILWCGALALQFIAGANGYTDLIKFDYVGYVGICFMPIAIYFLGNVFVNTKIKFKKRYLLLSIVPILSLIMLWTNDYHHLFYKKYDTVRNGVVYGPYFMIHTIYSYLLIGIGIIKMAYHSIKSAGFFSRQSILILIGLLIPIVVNILFTLEVVDLSIYATPISFSVAVFCFMIAIMKFKLLNVNSIALQSVVDKISDAFVVVNEDFEIIDYNETFTKVFNESNVDIRNMELFNLQGIGAFSEFTNSNWRLKKAMKKVIDNNEIVSFEKEFKSVHKFYTVELATIINKRNNLKLGVLILLKDITQHKKDIEQIKNNQEVMMESDRLASLGQLIGGIAHNLKTPIMSISGNLQGLQDLVTEYDLSIGDKEVNDEDHKEIAKDMKKLIDKTKIHLAYMSDIITAVKGQAVQTTEEHIFSPVDVLNTIDILMKHNLKKALINLHVDIEEQCKTAYIKGDLNGLVQVIDNIIQNAIYAYNGATNENIDLKIYRENNMVVFKVADYGCGIPKNVQKKLFKEMITTRGKNGTGLGLYMSYSMIKGNFKGDMYFETEEGKGTTFYIKIPIND